MRLPVSTSRANQTFPNYLSNDSIPADAMEKGDFDFMSWLAKHGAEQTRPSLDKVIQALKAQGVTKFGASGYCFGGAY